MKKVIIVAAIMALAFGSMACGSGPGLKTNRDSISYLIGAEKGVQIKFGNGDIGLDQEIILNNMKEFMANGDLESPEFQEEMEFMDKFHYTKFLPYAQIAQMHENSDRTDTLPALPELFDETYTRENVARGIGLSMGAEILSNKERFELVIPQVEHGIADAMKFNTIEEVETGLLISTEQMNQVYASFQQDMMKKQQEEYEKEMAERNKIATENGEASAKWLAEIEKMEGVKKTESGLLYRIDREGKGKKAKNDGDIVKVHYEGKTRDGKVFDSSYARNQEIEFPLNRVIKGWTEGMKLVKVGGQITLWIPAELAYGQQGAGQDIGPNEALEFKVELFDVTPEPKKKDEEKKNEKK